MVNDSYKKINSEISIYEAEKESLPRGYIRKKTIKGKSYFYLQYREGDRVRSVYIDKKTESEMEKKIAERKKIENKIRKLQQRKKILERKLGIHEYLPEKEVDYEAYSLFMSQLAHDHKRLGTEGFIEKYDVSKYRGINKRYLKGYRDYILGNKTENSRKSNKLVLDPYTYLMYFKYGNKEALNEELLKAIPEFLNQGLLITTVQEAVHE